MTTALLLSVEQAAQALGVSPWTVRQYVADGTLPRVVLPSTKGPAKHSRRVLVAVSDLERLISESRAGAGR